MHLRNLTMGIAGAAIGLAGMAATAAAEDVQFIPNLVYKTGPYAPSERLPHTVSPTIST